MADLSRHNRGNEAAHEIVQASHPLKRGQKSFTQVLGSALAGTEFDAIYVLRRLDHTSVI